MKIMKATPAAPPAEFSAYNQEFMVATWNQLVDFQCYEAEIAAAEARAAKLRAADVETPDSRQHQNLIVF